MPFGRVGAVCCACLIHAHSSTVFVKNSCRLLCWITPPNQVTWHFPDEITSIHQLDIGSKLLVATTKGIFCIETNDKAKEKRFHRVTAENSISIPQQALSSDLKSIVAPLLLFPVSKRKCFVVTTSPFPFSVFSIRFSKNGTKTKVRIDNNYLLQDISCGSYLEKYSMGSTPNTRAIRLDPILFHSLAGPHHSFALESFFIFGRNNGSVSCLVLPDSRAASGRIFPLLQLERSVFRILWTYSSKQQQKRGYDIMIVIGIRGEVAIARSNQIEKTPGFFFKLYDLQCSIKDCCILKYGRLLFLKENEGSIFYVDLFSASDTLPGMLVPSRVSHLKRTFMCIKESEEDDVNVLAVDKQGNVYKFDIQKDISMLEGLTTIQKQKRIEKAIRDLSGLISAKKERARGLKMVNTCIEESGALTRSVPHSSSLEDIFSCSIEFLPISKKISEVTEELNSFCFELKHNGAYVHSKHWNLLIYFRSYRMNVCISLGVPEKWKEESFSFLISKIAQTRSLIASAPLEILVYLQYDPPVSKKTISIKVGCRTFTTLDFQSQMVTNGVEPSSFHQTHHEILFCHKGSISSTKTEYKLVAPISTSLRALEVAEQLLHRKLGLVKVDDIVLSFSSNMLSSMRVNESLEDQGLPVVHISFDSSPLAAIQCRISTSMVILSLYKALQEPFKCQMQELSPEEMKKMIDQCTHSLSTIHLSSLHGSIIHARSSLQELHDSAKPFSPSVLFPPREFLQKYFQLQLSILQTYFDYRSKISCLVW